ncbi:MAG TPA: alpha-2-macroglobulin family protein, partial [bacterium]|nr:alpha-2-macroglobulin family protein [bacterium]
QCTYRDSDGNDYSSGTIYDVEGPYFWYEEEERVRPYERIQLLPDKKEYAIGDTIRILLKSTKPLTSCLLTVERDKVLEHRLIEVRNNEISIPVSKEFYPNAYISLTGMIPRGDFPTYQGEYDTDSPNFACGTLNVKIRNEVQSLKVQILDGADIPKSLPGQRMTLDFQVTDESNKAVTAELAVGVVDEQVLALTRYKTPDLSGLADFLLPLKLLTGENRTALQMQTPFKPLRNEPLSGGDGAYGDGRRDPLDAKLRKDFRPVAYFNPAVQTDDSGKASVTFEFPDSMTTYRVYVVACDAGTRFASVEKSALVVKDFYLEPGLPSFLIKGDQFQSQVAAFNKTDGSGAMSFDTKSSEQLAIESPSRSYALSAQDRVLVPLTGAATSVGTATVQLSAGFESKQDAVEIKLPVHSGYQRHRDVAFGVVHSGAGIEYTFPEILSQLPLDEIEPEDFTVELTLSKSPFLRMKPGLQYLLKYPYGCIEQTSSGVIPLAALRGLIRDGLVPGITIEEADKFLSKGVERLLSMQLNSGGFSYWPRQGQPTPWGSIYATTALLFAREAGFAVPDEQYQSALNYLVERMDEDSSNLDWGDTSFSGIVAFILAKSDRLSRGEWEKLQKQSSKIGLQGRMLLVLAGKQNGTLSEKEALSKFREILNEPPSDRRGCAYYAKHREDAIALYCCNEIIAAGTEAAMYSEKLLKSMNPDGRWSSTSDTGWALMALGNYFKGMNLAQGSVKGLARARGMQEGPFELDGADSITMSINAAEFLEQPSVDIETERDASLFYELVVVYPRVDYARNGYSGGFTLSKSIKNTDGSEDIRVGDVVEISITLWGKGQDLRYLVLDDPLPAGFVAINPALANEEPMRPTSSRDQDFYWRYWDLAGYYKLVPNHLEIRDDRVLVFRDNLWSGEYRYSYHARAVCAGTFKIPSTMLQLMYETDVCAYTPETMITVKERR